MAIEISSPLKGPTWIRWITKITSISRGLVHYLIKDVKYKGIPGMLSFEVRDGMRIFGGVIIIA